jgi:alkaline phosphatase D
MRPDPLTGYQFMYDHPIKKIARSLYIPGTSASYIAAAFLAAALVCAAGCRSGDPPDGSIPPDAFALAFGSCAKQWEEQPVWRAIAASRPHAFVFLGDNIYADGIDMEVKRRAYARLASNPGFMELKRTATILATWDDHDYGWNDAGGDYPAKKASQKLFLDFFDEPPGSPRWKRPGVYASYYFGEAPKRLQVILLDTRYFRDPLERTSTVPPYSRSYRPTADTAKTLLGAAQWKWLEGELSKPADARVLVSSIQLVAAEHLGEKWENFPHEKRRLYGLLRKTGAAGLVVISGDRHYAEFSAERENVPYPVYDFTSSGLNTVWPPGAAEPNRARIAGPAAVPNYGMLIMDWQRRAITAEIRDEGGALLMRHTVRLRDLRAR